ncbi:MAG: hypothetical protein WBA10_11545 [Elainellaceae cyanobacterium]
MTFATASTTALECPKCGKLTIVSQPDNSYRCLSCDFHRDFSKDKKKGSKPSGLLASVLTAAALMLFLL